ncbi:MAG: hypothetical protein Terrestrivirus4_37 [Terrestrivirus sp.]|uniref:Transmembrane protein n=1 Tax=Terrestrivirus sp. TaxID=2487775 RepID=A0A3G4ZRD5_9VIRU|nr:MAG: hypothetical protein Terrestrivirus4_37 [Terrestrivirus sp.]
MKSSTLMSIGFLVLLIAITLSSVGSDLRLINISKGQYSRCFITKVDRIYSTFNGITNLYQNVYFYHGNKNNMHMQTVSDSPYYIEMIDYDCWSTDFSNESETVIIKKRESLSIQSISYIVVSLISHIFVMYKNLN